MTSLKNHQTNLATNVNHSKPPRITPKRVVVSMIGIALLCIGVAFNNNTMFGNDPVGIVYDGLRITMNYSQAELGVASNYINVSLIIILLFFGRRYVNIGTLLYLIPYGLLISFGSQLYVLLFDNGILLDRVLGGVIGTSIFFIGVSLFVASNIGVDPVNGLVLTLRDKTGWSLQKMKVTVDLCLIVIGLLLGGKFGLITVITAITTGPAIQYLSQLFEKHIFAEKKEVMTEGLHKV